MGTSSCLTCTTSTSSGRGAAPAELFDLLATVATPMITSTVTMAIAIRSFGFDKSCFSLVGIFTLCSGSTTSWGRTARYLSGQGDSRSGPAAELEFLNPALDHCNDLPIAQCISAFTTYSRPLGFSGFVFLHDSYSGSHHALFLYLPVTVSKKSAKPSYRQKQIPKPSCTFGH